MKLLSISVAEPREIVFDGKTVRSSIWKEPVAGPVAVGAEGLAGNRQANRDVHGGEWKAAYAYSADHYAWWCRELGREDLAPGAFGENLTISGLDETRLRIGDRLTVGEVLFRVTGPRIPCTNLAARFQDHEMPKRFAEAGRCGAYLRVEREGVIEAGQNVVHEGIGAGVDLAALFRAMTQPRAAGAAAIMSAAMDLPGIDPELVRSIRKRLGPGTRRGPKSDLESDLPGEFRVNPNKTSTEPFETLDPEDWEGMRALAHRMVDDAIELIRHVREEPAWRPVPAEVKARFAGPAPRGPEPVERIYDEFRRDILPYRMGTIHPRFWAWYMGNGTITGALGDFLAAVMNSNVGGGNHVAPIVEAQVIDWMRAMMGLPAGASGLLTSGGSAANLIGITVARNAQCGYDVRHDGVRAAPGPLVAYASDEVHSCNKKAIETLGLGSEGLRTIAHKPDYTIDLKALRKQIRADRAAGAVPFCVIGNAGTINTGAIDDLGALADLCAREGLWLHVDGAIGAVAVLADNVREQLRGIERADSIALDLHKWMHVPFEAGCVLVRHEAAHRKAFSLTPEYLAHDPDGRGLAAGTFWPSDYGLQLTRQFRALKVWMSVKEHGLDRYGRMIARNVEQARYLGKLIEAEPLLELMAPIGLDIVCFRYNPGEPGPEALDQLNRDILAELHESGIAVPSYTTLSGRYCLRVAIANHRSRFDDFDLLVREVLRIGNELSG